MVKGIALFSVFAIFVAFSLCGCQRNESGSSQASNESAEQDFAKIHQNVNFNKEDKEKMHSLGMAAEENGSGGHGMGSVHGKKEKADPNKVIATVNNEKILRKDLDKILDRFKNHVNPATISSMEEQITDQLVTQSLLRQFVVEKS